MTESKKKRISTPSMKINNKRKKKENCENSCYCYNKRKRVVIFECVF